MSISTGSLNTDRRWIPEFKITQSRSGLADVMLLRYHDRQVNELSNIPQGWKRVKQRTEPFHEARDLIQLGDIEL